MPSIGSMIHCRAVSPSVPYSSPRMPSPGPLGGERLPDGPLDGQVGLRHRRAVGLRLDVEVAVAEPARRDLVGRVGEAQGEFEVGSERQRGCDVGHAVEPSGRAWQPDQRRVPLDACEEIVYAGTAFYTGDALAEALLEYARALARHDIADTVFVPGRTMQGEVDTIELLIGPASQIVSEPVELVGSEVEDPDTRRAPRRADRRAGAAQAGGRAAPTEKPERPAPTAAPASTTSTEIASRSACGGDDSQGDRVRSPIRDAPDVH